tara:strand:- start:332 stop:1018 length:687 start_codon:yes stop_codon:yes gene_type:complete
MANRNAPASTTFEQWRTEFNNLGADVGDVSALPTSINGTAVSTIAESITEIDSALSSVLFPSVIDFNDSTGPTNFRVKFGNDDDLQLFHDATNSRIQHSGTGDLIINTITDLDVLQIDGTDVGGANAGSQILLEDGYIILLESDDAGAKNNVHLAFNNSNKLTVYSGGIQINEGLDVTGDIEAAGKLAIGSSGITDLSGAMNGSLTFPASGGKIATEGFGIALAVALG